MKRDARPAAALPSERSVAKARAVNARIDGNCDCIAVLSDRAPDVQLRTPAGTLAKQAGMVRVPHHAVSRSAATCLFGAIAVCLLI